MSDMNTPPHPGEILRDGVLPGLRLAITKTARQLGVTCAALSRILNGRAAISPEMVLRLETRLGAEHSARATLWLRRQMAYDFWQAPQEPAES
jgi:addiction module HigA family antidote